MNSWQPHDDELQQTAPRKLHRNGTTGCLVAAFGLGLIGLSLFVPRLFFALFCLGGIGVFLIALFIPPRYTATCGACGNTVAPTSTLCPTCHIALAAPKTKDNSLLVLGLTLAIGLIIAGLLMHLNEQK